MSSSTFYLIILATAFLYCLHFSIAGTNETDRIIICAISLSCCLSFVLAGNNETDRLALLEIKAKITGDPLGVMSSWNNTLHFCEWYGVTCGRRHQRVTALNLHSSKLTGILSPHIGNLSFLKELHLQNNSFGGTIPPQINSLHRLQALLLLNNSLSGEIPSNISGCYNLVHVSLSNNLLVGRIPPSFGSLSHLQILYLTKNNLIGNIPSSFGNLSSLFVLSTAENNLAGRITNSLGNLKNLNILYLDDNKFTGVVPPAIFNLSSLISLDLSMNELEGNLLSDLGNNIFQIEEFIIFSNRFTGHIPASISNSSDLVVLDVSENNLLGPVPSLHNLAKLTHLVIHSNSLGFDKVGDLNFVESLVNSTNFIWLEIGQNNFRGVFPKIICNFSSLFAIYLGDNYLTGEIPDCIENVANLFSFEASNNELSGAIPQGIWKLQNLNFLSLHGNQLTGVIPDSIGHLTELSLVDLSNNHLEGQIPSSFGNCTSLIALALSNNTLSGKIPSKLFSLPPFSIELDLSGNHLIGSLPEEIGQLNNIDSLDVSRNMLSGQIPSSLSSCVSLEILRLGKNNFHGTIPHALQTLKGLRDLNFSYNNLSGEIPKFLASFKLQSLDLSYNNLDGVVPTGGVFSNASNISIIGNMKLCGGIPDLKLPHCNFNNNTKERRSTKHHVRKLVVSILSGLLGVSLLVVVLVFVHIWWRRKARQPITSGDSENFPNLSYKALLEATNGFSAENIIGSGTFGVVYKGILGENGPIVAIKVFNLEYRGASKSFKAECGVLRNIRHRNLVKVITACSSIDYQGRDFRALVYEYMVNGSLDDWLHPTVEFSDGEGNVTSRNLNFRQRLDIAVDVASSLDYLHHHGDVPIVHCDLKPNNVLLDDEMVAHVSDFGLAKFISKGIGSSPANQSSSLGVRGTIGYAPPEYGLGNEVSTYGDVYSFGILLLEMFTGKRPTDDMFKGDLSLHGSVKEALPEHMIETLDHVLVEEIDCEETNSSSMLEALSSILEIALSCSTNAPQERLDMSDVVAKLSSTRDKLLGTRLQQRRRKKAGTQGW